MYILIKKKQEMGRQLFKLWWNEAYWKSFYLWNLAM